VKPRFDRGILDTWWYDEAKAAKLGKKVAASPDDSAPSSSRRPLLIIAALGGLALAGFFIWRSRRQTRPQ
jgi:MYXO-CTERM domain-containing protein